MCIVQLAREYETDHNKTQNAYRLAAPLFDVDIEWRGHTHTHDTRSHHAINRNIIHISFNCALKMKFFIIIAARLLFVLRKAPAASPWTMKTFQE